MHQKIKNRIKESLFIKQQMFVDHELLEVIGEISLLSISAFHNGNKVLFCGNGGSAADAQHLAAELSGRYYLDRPPLNAEALHVNSSFLTAVANDFGFEKVFSRLVEAKGENGDVLFALSTSGNSENIIAAMQQAKKQDMTVVALTGASGGKMKEYCDFLVKIPSADTPRIQEGHMLIGHIICELVENAIFGKNKS